MTPTLPISVMAPAGAVTAFAGYVQPPAQTNPDSDPYNTEPIPEGFGLNAEVSGWMVCDGRQLQAKAYPVLFSMIGFLYNQSEDKYQPGDEQRAQFDQNTMFRIPDYRGYFLRMVSGKGYWPAGENPDPDVRNRKLTNGFSQNTGVGSVQADALQDHQHSLSVNNLTQPMGGQPQGFPVPNSRENVLTSSPTDNTSGNPGHINVSRETRAKNMYVFYLIKVS